MNETSTLVQRAIIVAREEGLLACARRTVKRVLRGPTFRRYYVLLLNVSDGVSQARAKIPITYGVLNPAELESLAKVDHFQKPTQMYRSRLTEGQVCFAAKHEGRIVAATWIQTGFADSTGPLGRGFPLRADEAYGHSAFTVPEYRGNRIMPELNDFALKWLAQLGFRRLVILVDQHNGSALNADHRAGFRRVGSVGYLEMLGWRWSFCSVRGVFGALGKHNRLLHTQPC